MSTFYLVIYKKTPGRELKLLRTAQHTHLTRGERDDD
jgi:hypothetical protein